MVINSLSGFILLSEFMTCIQKYVSFIDRIGGIDHLDENAN